MYTLLEIHPFLSVCRHLRKDLILIRFQNICFDGNSQICAKNNSTRKYSDTVLISLLWRLISALQSNYWRKKWDVWGLYIIPRPCICSGLWVRLLVAGFLFSLSFVCPWSSYWLREVRQILNQSFCLSFSHPSRHLCWSWQHQKWTNWH